MQKLSRTLPSLALALVVLLVSFGCSKAARTQRHLEAGNRLLAAGKFDEAEIEYKHVLLVEPANAQATGGLGIIYLKEGRIARAVPFLLRGRELQPTNLDFRSEIGAAYLSAGKTAEARQEALYILQNRPTDEYAPLLLARAARSAEEIRSARATLQALPQTGANKVSVLAAMGVIAMREGNASEGEARLKQALAINPSFAEAHAALGGFYFGSHDLVSAEREIAAAAKFSPPRSERKLQYAQFKFQQGDSAAARKILEDISAVTPDYLPALIALAEIDFSEKKYSETRSLLAKVAAREAIQPDAILLRARLFLANGENTRAVAELEQMTSNFPLSAPAFYYLGTAYITTGQIPRALASLTEAVRLAPNAPESVVLLANLNIARGNLLAARKSLEGLLKQNPAHFQAWILLAEIFVRQGDFASARSVYDQASRYFPENAQTAVLRGQTYARENNAASAASSFNRALELTPFFRAAEEELVTLEVRAKNYEAARTRLESVVAHDPSQSWAQLLLAKILVAEDKLDEAQSTLQKTIARDPELAEAYLMMAGIYSAKHEEKNALASLRDSTKKDPKNFQAFMLLALLSDRDKNYAEARTAYEHAAELNPRSGAALNNLAYIYSDRFNELDKGYEAAQRARAELPLDGSVEDTLGWILFKKKQFGEALGLLRESAGKLSTSPEAQFHLGQALAVTGNEAEAKEVLSRAIALSPDFNGNAEARTRLAYLSLDTSKFDSNQLTLLEAEFKRAPDDPVVGLRLAALYELEGSLDKAKEVYEKLRQANPENLAVALASVEFYAKHNQAAKALELAKIARKQFPDNADVAYDVGRLLFATGDYAGGFSVLQDVRHDRPDDPEVEFDFAQAAFYCGQVAQAEAATDRALSERSKFSRAEQARDFKRLIDLTARDPLTDDEKSLINRQLKQDPDGLISLLLKAGQGERAGDSAGEAVVQAKLVERFPTFLPALRRLAIALGKKRSTDESSVNIAVKARTAFPDDPQVAKAYGILLYLRAEFPRATTLLKEAAAKLPQDAEVFYYLGNAENKLSRREDGAADLRTAAKLGFPDPLRSEITGSPGT